MLTGRLDSPALALAIRCGHFKNKTYKKWSLQGHRDQEVSLLVFVFCSVRNGNWGFVCAGQVLAHLAVIASPQSTGFCTFLFYFVLLNPSLCTLHPLDAAFLAREKAKADAECYTALKIAEANKVKTWPPHTEEVTGLPAPCPVLTTVLRSPVLLEIGTSLSRKQ